MTAAGRAPRSQGPRLAIIVAVVIIDVLGIGLMWPVLPVLIRELPAATFRRRRRSTAESPHSIR
jgi:hypothetical protein